MIRLGLALLLCLAGCYTGNRVSRDINQAWQGKSRAAIEARWGAPVSVAADGDAEVLIWSYERRHVELPSGSAEVDVDTATIDAEADAPGGSARVHIEVPRVRAGADVKPGRVWTSTTSVRARVSATGLVEGVEGPSIRWGPPPGANIRWGFLFGFHAGMGRLDDTSTPLPSGGLYIGGMLSRTLGLVGTYSFTSGKDDAGGAIAQAWGIAAQSWVTRRLWLRAGPAMVLAFDPGFENAGLEPGINAGASYAIIKSGSFVLDLRLDVTGGTSTAFGNVGIGVNIN